MADDLVRMEYTGINRGPIPFRGVSGTVYRGSSVTYRFVDVLPEDVTGLIATGKFREVERPEKTKTVETSETVSNVFVGAVADQPAGDAVDGPVGAVEAVGEFMDDALTVDLATVASVRDSLKDEIPIKNLESAFNQENAGDNPRKTVLDLLENAIKNHPDYVGSV